MNARGTPSATQQVLAVLNVLLCISGGGGVTCLGWGTYPGGTSPGQGVSTLAREVLTLAGRRLLTLDGWGGATSLARGLLGWGNLPWMPLQPGAGQVPPGQGRYPPIGWKIGTPISWKVNTPYWLEHRLPPQPRSAGR